ncbi:hypothetical protein [Nocardioides humi]|uniref:Uncharacterized protein n=1 Tax=Nocardioides humi TaxID=449461 RepID=A0ABN2BTB0_9ACTN|nr:hypothetical protein [Nocardioides humi]
MSTSLHSRAPLASRSATPWPLVLTLAAVALVRPLLSITGLADDWGRPLTPLLATAAITAVWIGAVLVTRQADPVRVLVATGLVYAVLATALSGVLSPILDGELHGPLTNPIALVAMLAVNAGWGALAGMLALRLRRRRS